MGDGTTIILGAGLTGLSIMVQGGVVSPSAANTAYATTDGHELRGS